MDLLKDIQDAAIDVSTDVISLLRKCKVLAARLGNPDFKRWVDHELNGYPSREDLQKYRILKVQSHGNFSGPFGSGLRNVAIPPTCLPKEWRDMASTAYLTAGLSAYNALLERDPDKPGTLMIPWPPDLLPHIQVYEDMSCYAAWRQIPRNAIVNLIDTIRNRILDFVLEIVALSPQKDKESIKTESLPKDQVRQVFNTYIMGDVSNLATGSSNFSQIQQVEIFKDDMDSLKKYLSSIGISKDDISDLEIATKADGNRKKEDGFGPKVSNWIGEMVSKSLSGAWNIASNVAVNILTKAISAYYGYA